jgi:uncharacterized protein
MPLVLIILLFALAFGASRYCLGRYETAIARGRRIKAPQTLTGEEIAIEFLKSEGIEDVQVAEHNGVVSDYYDPARKRLFLRREFKDGADLAAWAVALHEAAHATQTGETLDDLKWRRSCIKMTRYVPTLTGIISIALIFLKVLTPRYAILALAAMCVVVLLMNIGSLAVERNANLRLRRFLEAKLGSHSEAHEEIERLLSAVAMREVGDLIRSPRYFFFSALPGSSKVRPR